MSRRIEPQSEARLVALKQRIAVLERRVVALESVIEDDVERARDELLSAIVRLIGPEIEFDTSSSGTIEASIRRSGRR